MADVKVTIEDTGQVLTLTNVPEGTSEDAIRAKVKEYQAQGMLGSEPTTFERFMSGLGRPYRESYEAVAQALPGQVPRLAQATPGPPESAITKAPKLPPQKHEG